jgi:hypothetical protein
VNPINRERLASILRSTILRDVITTLVILLAFHELIKGGAIAVGDWVVVPNYDWLDMIKQRFLPVHVSLRNAGYDVGIEPFQWSQLPFDFLAYIFALITHDPTEGKLALLCYLVIGGIATNHLLDIVMVDQIQKHIGGWDSLVKTLCSILYMLNPAIMDFLARGYLAALQNAALLPLVLLTYIWLSRSNSKSTAAYRALVFALTAYMASTLSYPILMVILVVAGYELPSFLKSRRNAIAAVRRMFLLFALELSLELPLIYLLAVGRLHELPSLLTSGSPYLEINSPATLINVLSLSFSSYTNSFFQSRYPVQYHLFTGGAICIVILDIAVLLHRRFISSWVIRSSGLFAVSVAFALGAYFAPNVWLFTLIPAFPEAFEFLALVALSLVLLSASQFAITKRPKIAKRSIVLVSLLALLVLVSAVPTAMTAARVLSPVSIPEYDQAAYKWLASRPDDGRILLIPPTYAIEYTWNPKDYSIDTDYWTLSPPKPIIIGNGGPLGGYESMIGCAFYNVNSSLFRFLINALGVKYVVLRTDVASVWGAPCYKEVSVAFVVGNYPFLRLAEQFGQIAVFENPDYDGLMTAFRYPILVEGNSSLLTNVAKFLAPRVPIVFSQDLSARSQDDLVTDFDPPVLIPCDLSCAIDAKVYPSHRAIGFFEGTDTDLVLENLRWKYIYAVTYTNDTEILYSRKDQDSFSYGYLRWERDISTGLEVASFEASENGTIRLLIQRGSIQALLFTNSPQDPFQVLNPPRVGLNYDADGPLQYRFNLGEISTAFVVVKLAYSNGWTVNGVTPMKAYGYAFGFSAEGPGTFAHDSMLTYLATISASVMVISACISAFEVSRRVQLTMKKGRTQ